MIVMGLFSVYLRVRYQTISAYARHQETLCENLRSNRLDRNVKVSHVQGCFILRIKWVVDRLGRQVH